ncbi:LuxR C-terminal-related transcriptional regulator [Paenibacillus sp. sptzw28]|uniref:helix-turn-helix transcriptional regulator n=1 Tax=Paenibacillus sp. sptzw28 TaxID=715179 RepID=UPI001C6DD75C|nr:LuxR C-terminal-related transcriptional regulator [Paenibacillus sp. sptzw28]QYR19458.1 LuxR C-terminal-related transcriptional regulator [Paenibacillus sp. sptzw28]
MTKIKLTIDSNVKDETGRAKLADLHLAVIEQVMRLGICENVKVTLECGGALVDSNPEEGSLPAQAAAPKGALSDRQQQIAAMLCEHYSIKRIASELYVSENTVKKHIQNMKKALEIDKSGADFTYVLKQMLKRGGI